MPCLACQFQFNIEAVINIRTVIDSTPSKPKGLRPLLFQIHPVRIQFARFVLQLLLVSIDYCWILSKKEFSASTYVIE